MSIVATKSYGVIVTVVLAVVGAAVAGVILITSGSAGGVNLTSAALVPADATFYIGVNTDLSSKEWVAAFGLVERLGQDDPEQQLRDSAAEEGGLDWENDVAPFLGGNASIFIRGFDINTFAFEGAAVLRCKDATRALEVVLEQWEGAYEEVDFGGVTYYVPDFEVGAVALIGDHLVLALDEGSIREVIRVHVGDTPPLSEAADFKSLRDELTNNFLAFLYLSPDRLVEGFGDPGLATLLRDAGASPALQPMAAALGAKSDSFNLQLAVTSDSDRVLDFVRPRDSRFVEIVPADTTIFFVTRNIGELWRETVDANRDAIDELVASSGEFESLDDALDQVARELNLESLDELIALLGGEVAFAAWFPTGDEDSAEGLVLAEVSDEAEARRVLAALFSDLPSRTERIADTDVVVFDDEGDEGAFAVRDGHALVGTVEGVRRVLERSGGSLAQSAGYRQAAGEMPTALATFGYFDLSVLLRLSEAGIPPTLDRAEEVLGGAIINLVADGGIARVSGVVTIAE